MHLFFAIAMLVSFTAPALAEGNCGSLPTQVEQTECVAQEFYELESVLTALTEEEAANTKKMEAESKEAGTVAYEGIAATFDKSVSTFNAYLEAACAYEAATYGAGSGAASAEFACKKELVGQRINQLRRDGEQ